MLLRSFAAKVRAEHVGLSRWLLVLPVLSVPDRARATWTPTFAPRAPPSSAPYVFNYESLFISGAFVKLVEVKLKTVGHLSKLSDKLGLFACSRQHSPIGPMAWSNLVGDRRSSSKNILSLCGIRRNGHYRISHERLP